MPRRRSPARFLAPLALVAVVVTALLIVQHNRNADSNGGDSSATTSTLERTGGSTTTTASDSGSGKKARKKSKKVYVVKSGDILSKVAEQTGLTVEQLQEYNPGIDPQALPVGQRLKLTGPSSSSGDETDTTTTP